jgi:hypothetical protein
MSRSLVSSRLTFAAKAGPFVPVAAEGTSETDWLPEESGFEPSVPPRLLSRSSDASPEPMSARTCRGVGLRPRYAYVIMRHWQLAAGLVADSPLEESGFEPSVPPTRESSFFRSPLRFSFRRRERVSPLLVGCCVSTCAEPHHGSGSLPARPASRTSSSLPASMSSSEPKAFV